MKRNLPAGLLLLSGVTVCMGAMQVSPLKRLALTKEDPKVEEALERAISSVRTAFLVRDTERLTNALADKKIFLSLRVTGAETGFYTGSQIRFLFDRMFRELRTKSFTYTPEGIDVPEEGRAFVRTDWTYTVSGAETSVTEKLVFSLEKEQGSWNVSEIKAAPR